VIEVDKRVGWPQTPFKFFARNDFAGFFQKQSQDLERLLLQFDFDAVAAEFAGPRIKFVNAETNVLWQISVRKCFHVVPHSALDVSLLLLRTKGNSVPL